MMVQKRRREPNFEQLLKVLNRQGKPDYLPFYEHLASGGFIGSRTGTDYDKMELGSDVQVQTYVDFWLGMGYDYIPLETGLRCPPNRQVRKDGVVSHGSESQVVIQTREDFEKYPWPSESDPIDFSMFEKVGKILPDGVKIIGGVGGGPYEWAAKMMGTIGLAYLLADDPELVQMVFEKIGSLHIAANRILATMDWIGAHRQGDDLGYKTSTFLPPNLLRQLVFPTYKEMASAAHHVKRPFILHSCGNLNQVYDDIIACGIDAKHSFEDVILPVTEFQRRYGKRITALGGLDVDVICRSTPDELREYTLNAIEQCFDHGHWALGTGNSLTNYMPVDNYIMVLEVAMEFTA